MTVGAGCGWYCDATIVGAGPASARRAAVAKSMQDAYRSSGRFAIAFAITGSSAADSPARLAATDGGGSWRWPRMISAGAGASNGATPVSNQYSAHASEYWSERWSRCAPVICSGEA